VLYYVLAQGWRTLNWQFFTQEQPISGAKDGGMKDAIVGSLIIISIASCIGLPCGILGGVYLAEFGNNRLGAAVRFAADVLNGIPSIIIGVFVYAVAILPLPEGHRHFSAWAGGLALGIMMIPTIMRTTEEIVRLVPTALRDASLALGATRSRTTFKIVLNAAKGGVITGVLLAIARIDGETAPLLFTAFGNQFLSYNPSDPMSALPLKIFNFATSPDERWIELAWGGSLVLVGMVFILSLAARYFTRGQYRAVK
jgi:phosphate transport system permease protein